MPKPLLVCADTYPYPADRGDRVRYAHFLETLSRLGDVELVLIRRAAEAAARPAPAATDVTLSPTEVAINVARGALTAVPAQFSGFASRRARGAVAERAQACAAFVALGARAALYRDAVPRSVPTILDLQDSLVLNAAAQLRAARGPLRRLYGIDARLKSPGFESRLLRSFDVVTVAGPSDLDEARRRSSDTEIRLVPTAVDVADAPPASRPVEPRVLFLGDLRFAPNVDAVTFLVDHIWPRVSSLHQSARLWVVGHAPERKLERKLRRADIEVAFSVPEVAPFFDDSAVLVAPMRIGSGVKVKVLQAMAHGVPIVMTRHANTGIGASDREQASVADDADGFARAVVELLDVEALRRRYARAAWGFVRARYSKQHVSELWAGAVADVMAR